MKRFSSDLFCVFVLLQMFFVIQSGGGGGLLPDFVSNDSESLDEESLDKTIDDSNNDALAYDFSFLSSLEYEKYMEYKENENANNNSNSIENVIIDITSHIKS